MLKSLCAIVAAILALSPATAQQLKKVTVGGIPSPDGQSAQLWTTGPSGNIAMTGTVQY